MEKFLEHIRNDAAGKYIKMCHEAMCQLIDNKYLIGSESEKDLVYERNLLISFAYLLGRDYSDKIKPNYLIGGEVSKSIFNHFFNLDGNNSFDNDWIDFSKNKLEFDSTYVSPDFLIHRYKKFKDISRGGQKLIVEAKSKKGLSLKDFKKDLFKLNVYLSRLKFEKALYVIVNSTKDEVDSKIKSYMEENLFWSSYISKKLIFIIQDDEEHYPKVFKLRVGLYEKVASNWKSINNIKKMDL